MSELSFNDYQAGTAHTAIYPEAGTGSLLALSYVSLGLGETGEIQGKVKKIIRDSNGIVNDEKRREIGKEIGDVLWYLARLAEELDYPLGYLAQANLTKLSDRKERGVLQGSGDNR